MIFDAFAGRLIGPRAIYSGNKEKCKQCLHSKTLSYMNVMPCVDRVDRLNVTRCFPRARWNVWRQGIWREFILNTKTNGVKKTRQSSDASKKAGSFVIATMIAMLPVASAEKVTLNITGKPLYGVMREVHALSGAEIKVPPNLADDIITRSVREETWQSALNQLLLGYDYVVAWGNDSVPSKLIVCCRNQNADELMAVQAVRASTSEDLLIYEPGAFSLPEKYKGLNPRSISSVSIPVERMKQMKIGERVSLSLPSGQFEVIHDKQFQHETGDVTWVGYLETPGEDYRVIITMAGDSNLGQVVTPEGSYNLDTQEGHTWLVDASAANLQ